MTQDTTINDDRRWTTICPYPRLEPERGVAALVDGEQIAVFRTYDDRLFAIGQRDPIAGAYVMARGIVGSRGDAPTVASPLHKQVYDLRTGECLDVPGVRVPSYPVRCRDGLVEVATRPVPPPDAAHPDGGPPVPAGTGRSDQPAGER